METTTTEPIVDFHIIVAIFVAYSVVAAFWGFFLNSIRREIKRGNWALPWAIAVFWPIFVLAVTIGVFVDYFRGVDV